MKLYLLRPVDNLPDNDNPWDPWYNKCFGFVVRAKNEPEARQFATEDAGDENRGTFMGAKISRTNAPWLDPMYSTCVELKKVGDAGVIIKDFASA